METAPHGFFYDNYLNQKEIGVQFPLKSARLISLALLSLGLTTNAYSDNFFDDEDYQRQQSQADKGFDELDQTDDEGVWHKPKPAPAPPKQEKVIVIIKEVQAPAPTPAPAPAPAVQQPPAAVAPVAAPAPQPEPVRSPKITKTGSGIAFEFDSCIKEGSDVACHFNITSQYFDRTIAFGSRHRRLALMYDNVGNEYRFYKIKIGSQEALNPHDFRSNLIADVTVPLTFFFSNISTQARSIAKLEFNGTANKSGKWENFALKFKKLPFIEQ